MVKDMLEEASFDASPGSIIPEPIAKVAPAITDAATRRTTHE